MARAAFATAVQRYQEGQALLAQRPVQHRGLEDVGGFDLGIHIHVAWDLKERGAATLRDLGDWSEAELRGCRDFGPKKIAVIKAVMAQHGLRLHPDRETPIKRPACWEKKRSENDWAKKDRAFIHAQARRVADTFYEACDILNDGRDDAACFAVIARALQRPPSIGNPLIADFKRLREEAKSAAKRHVQLKEAIEERATATRRIAELVAMDEPAGKVIQFPARLH